MDVNQKVKHLAKSRGWSEYRLAKESGLAGSLTLAFLKYYRESFN